MMANEHSYIQPLAVQFRLFHHHRTDLGLHLYDILLRPPRAPDQFLRRSLYRVLSVMQRILTYCIRISNCRVLTL